MSSHLHLAVLLSEYGDIIFEQDWIQPHVELPLRNVSQGIDGHI